jgi:hypothetical protein
MSVLSKKQKVFGNIAAAKTLTESMPKLKLSSSFPSVNNKGDTITFLTDLIKALIGYIALVNAIVDILTNSLAKIEKEIKKALKTELKSIVSCGVDPSLPSFIKSTGSGIVIEVKKVDFLDLFKTDATTKVGNLLYNDVTSPLTDSSDFNTFLYGVIQNDGTQFTWKDKNGVGLLDVKFTSLGTGSIPNNTLTLKANPAYDNKSLNDLNNSFIDSLTLFNTENIVSRIIDIIFGSISVSISKTRKQLETEEKINAVVDKMVNDDLNAKESEDENYFTFNNDEISLIERRSGERQRGVVKIKTSTTVDGSVPVTSLTAFTNDMSSATTPQDKKKALANNLDNMANDSANNINNGTDKVSVKLNFVQSIISNLIKAIIGIVLSPKIVMIFLVNYKIVYGPTATFGDAIDFIKKNRKLFKAIMKKIAGMIIRILLAIAMQKIAKLVADAAIKKNIDKNKNKVSQLLSLAGVPQQALRAIKGLA